MHISSSHTHTHSHNLTATAEKEPAHILSSVRDTNTYCTDRQIGSLLWCKDATKLLLPHNATKVTHLSQTPQSLFITFHHYISDKTQSPHQVTFCTLLPAKVILYAVLGS